MIADATFLWHLLQRESAAMGLLASRRAEVIRTCIVAAGEIVPLFPTNEDAWNWLQPWRIYRLHDGIVGAAAEVDGNSFKQAVAWERTTTGLPALRVITASL